MGSTDGSVQGLFWLSQPDLSVTALLLQTLQGSSQVTALNDILVVYKGYVTDVFFFMKLEVIHGKASSSVSLLVVVVALSRSPDPKSLNNSL